MKNYALSFLEVPYRHNPNIKMSQV